MFGTNVLDKDGISAAVVMAEMAAYLSSCGLTLTQQLDNLYKRSDLLTLVRFISLPNITGRPLSL